MTSDPFGPFVNSFSRLEVVLNNSAHMDRLDWFRQLGDAWSSCDNVWRWRKLLASVLSSATPEELAAMMSDEDRARLAALPERVTVYRGCYPLNRVGLSWSLDEATARRFVTLNRYRQNAIPIIRTARAKRARVVLKLDRGEAEIIAPRVFATRDVQLIGTCELSGRRVCGDRAAE